MLQRTRNGTDIVKDNSQERSLKFLYTTLLGRLILKPLTAPWISKVAGAFLSTKASCVLIKPFIKSNNIDMSRYEDVKFGSYNEFFSRKIKADKVNIDMDREHFVAPADSKLTAVKIDDNCRLMIKNTPYTVESLVKNKALAAKYRGGYALIFRLEVDDYHRYMYVVDGEKGENTFIQGVLHTVNPIANDYYPFYKENSREYTTVENDVFGSVTAIEVGALMVGKIVNHHGRKMVKRGEEKGYFQFGGSTVVVLVEGDKIVLDDDILANSAQNIETIVKIGEKVAAKKR